MSAESVGQIGLDLVVNQNQFNKQMSGITSLAKKAGAALAAAFAVKKVVDFGKQCLELGSDLQEVQNVVDVTFPHMTSQVDQFAKSAAASFGLSETMAKQYTGTFGAMAKAFGFSESAAYEMGTALTGLAGDVASFYNLSQDEAYTKLKSVFTGETETLKDLGVVMTQAALDQYALANGYGKTTAAMTEQEKVALRYAFVQQQLSAAQGDFARTSDSWANQTRVMALQLQSIMATIGQGLINLFTPVIKIVNVVLGKIATLANAFKSFTELITGNKSSGSSSVAAPVSELAGAADTASSGLSDASGAAGSLADTTKGVGSAAKKAAKEMKALMGFDQIQKLDTPTDTSSGGTSGGGGGSAGSGGGALGSAVDFGSLAAGETVIDEVDSKFVKMFQNIKKLCDPAVKSLKRLWNEGLSRLGSFAWGSLKDFYNHFLVPVGKWTIGTGIPRFVDALNNGLMKVDFDKIRGALTRLWDALAPFSVKIGEGLLWLWENALVPLGTWAANEVVPRYLDGLSAAINAFNAILGALQPLFQWFWDSVLQPIAQWTGGVFLSIWDGINQALRTFASWCGENSGAIQNMTIIIGSFFAAFKISQLISGIAQFVSSIGGVAGAVSSIGSLIGTVLNPFTLAIGAIVAAGVLLYKNWDTISAKATELFNEHLSPMFQALTSGISSIVNTFLNAWSTYISPVLDELVAKFTTVWSENIQPLLNTALDVIGKIGDLITVLWTTILQPFFTELIETSAPVLGAAISAVGTVFTDFLATVADVADGILGALGGVIDFVTGVFSGDWETAVNGLQSIAEGFQDAINAVFDFIRDSILQPFDDFLSGVFEKDWTDSFGAFGEVLNGFFEIVESVWDTIKGVFEGIMDFVSNVFAGNWSDAWDSVVGIFETVFGGIIDIAKTPINGVIGLVNGMLGALESGINWVISKINTLSFEVPSWVPGIGGQTWGFNIPTVDFPQVPYLAEGGYVKANTPQLAMIGDNRHQGEVIAPEDKLQAMVDAAVKAASAPGLTREDVESIINQAVMRIVAALAQMGFYIDSEEIARATQKGNRSTRYQFNKVDLQ